MARLPLEGIRIIDSTYVFALPYAGGLLADMGAEVIKVEGPGRPDVTRTGGYAGQFPENDIGEDWWNRPSTYNLIHRGKQSITLDMKEGRIGDGISTAITPQAIDGTFFEFSSGSAFVLELAHNIGAGVDLGITVTHRAAYWIL